MNVASLELCKELYDLSGWEPEWFGSFRNGSNDLGYYRQTEYDETPMLFHEWLPAYDLGYLLRRLSDQEDLSDLALHRCEHQDGSLNWAVEVTNLNDVFGDKKFVYEDSPEDAATKLAIELFKQGILTKEQS